MNLDELIQRAIKSFEKGNNTLGKGWDGVVYAVDEKVVLKVHTGDVASNSSTRFHLHSDKKSAEYEFNLGRELHQKGVQVPEYLGLFRPLDIPTLQYWGIFMERIYGIRFEQLSDRLQREARLQYQRQVDAIRCFGYKPKDNSLDHNTLFDQQQEKLFLFDLVRWTKL